MLEPAKRLLNPSPIDSFSSRSRGVSQEVTEFCTSSKVQRIALYAMATATAIIATVGFVVTGQAAFIPFALSSIPMYLFASTINDDPVMKKSKLRAIEMGLERSFLERELLSELKLPNINLYAEKHRRAELLATEMKSVDLQKIEAKVKSHGRKVQKKIEASYEDKLANASNYIEKEKIRRDRDLVCSKARKDAEDKMRLRLIDQRI